MHVAPLLSLLLTPSAFQVVHSGIIDAHTHYASVGLPQQATPATVIGHHHPVFHAACHDAAHYYGRSDYVARKEAEYRAKYGGKYGVGQHHHLMHGAGIINEELDAYIHSSGTGFKQWQRRREARKQIKRSVQYVAACPRMHMT
jgi:hypothetical protein